MDEEVCTQPFSVCLDPSSCLDGKQATAACWIGVICQIGVAVLLLVIPFVREVVKERQEKQAATQLELDKINEKKETVHLSNILRELHADDVEDGMEEEMQRKLEASSGWLDDEAPTKKCSTTSVVPKTKSDDSGNTTADLKEKLSNKRSPLIETERSLENFLKTNADKTIKFPSSYGPEYVNSSKLSTLQFLKTICTIIVKSEESQNIIMYATGSALISASLSGILFLLFRHENYQMRICADVYAKMEEEPPVLGTWFQANASSLKASIDGFKFLPIFLLLAYVAFLVERWRTFMAKCHALQGRIQDIGVLLGGCLSVGEDSKRLIREGLSRSIKVQLYKIYRYLNVIHIINYQRWMDGYKNHYDVTEKLRLDMNLLTEEEEILIDSMEAKARDGICALLQCEVSILFDKIMQNDTRESKRSELGATSIVVKQKICDLRAVMATMHDMFVRDNPNEYIYAMQILVFLFTVLIIFGYPFFTFVSVTGEFDGGCFQPVAFIGTFVTLLSLRIPFVLCEVMQNPFDAVTGIHVENLVASTEMSLFQSMRIMFHSAGGNDDNLTGDFRRASTMNRQDAFNLKKLRLETVVPNTKGGHGDL